MRSSMGLKPHFSATRMEAAFFGVRLEQEDPDPEVLQRPRFDQLHGSGCHAAPPMHGEDAVGDRGGAVVAELQVHQSDRFVRDGVRDDQRGRATRAPRRVDAVHGRLPVGVVRDHLEGIVLEPALGLRVVAGRDDSVHVGQPAGPEGDDAV
jgi:hypothetical protein